jgi:hypothetical protein
MPATYPGAQSMPALANGRLQIICLLVYTGFSGCTVAGNAYQWTDQHGQIYFGDNPPAQAESREIRLPRQRESGAKGLRPGEIATLQRLEQRADRQQRRARAARRRSEQQRTAGREACRAHREQLRQAQGKDGFKKHARYLRTHCW